MPVDSKDKILKKIKQRKYLNKDFDSLKSDLLEYARNHFPNQIRDFSESSLGGLFLDLAAYVGDVNSFYLDHQFHELSLDTAVELRNIESIIRRSGVPIVGASPAVVNASFFIEVPAKGSPPEPNTVALPVIHTGTVIRADSGVQFELTEDVDFRETDNNGDLVANITIGSRDNNNTPTTFILSKKGVCVSGFRNTESFSIGNFTPFKQFTLSRENITEIIRVRDSLGNEYNEVDFLTQDTVFKAVANENSDNDLVPEILAPKPAPYRFTTQTSLDTRLTTLTFGGGSAETIDDDIIPDPSQFAVPLFGKKTFSRFTVNPGQMLQTTTLGVVAPNSAITIDYRHGGGLNHNVGARSIREISSLTISFPNDPSPSLTQFVRQNIDVINTNRASGGEDAPTVSELKQRVPAVKASQGRIVSKEDLLARVYTMPSNFGRVFRASIQPDPNNPLSSRLFIISRDNDNKLIVSPDSLKKNIQRFLSEFRLISDAVDILDAQVINLKIDFSIVIDPSFGNSNLILQNVVNRLIEYFNIKNFEIDQPIVLDDIKNIIFNNRGVRTIDSLNVENITGVIGEDNPRVYSDVQFDVEANTDRGIIIPPPGSIFEVRHKDFDIAAAAV